MALRVGSPNFSKGELAPELTARVDVAAYSAGAARARNVVILKYGGLTKRPGTRIVAEVHDASQPVRLFPFQFSISQTYALEMGQGYMRPAALGGMVVETQLTITAATQANPVQITATYHGYGVGDEVFIDNVAGMTDLNGRIFRVAQVLDANNFTIAVDGTGFAAFIGDAGGVTNSTPPAPPPPPPSVPPPVTPPDPPDTGGGGDDGNGWDYYKRGGSYA